MHLPYIRSQWCYCMQPVTRQSHHVGMDLCITDCNVVIEEMSSDDVCCDYKKQQNYHFIFIWGKAFYILN